MIKDNALIVPIASHDILRSRYDKRQCIPNAKHSPGKPRALSPCNIVKRGLPPPQSQRYDLVQLFARLRREGGGYDRNVIGEPNRHCETISLFVGILPALLEWGREGSRFRTPLPSVSRSAGIQTAGSQALRSIAGETLPSPLDNFIEPLSAPTV